MKALAYPSLDGNEIPICWACANECGISTYTIEVDELASCTRCGDPADGNIYHIERHCMLCGKPSFVYLTADQHRRWLTTWKAGTVGGPHIQIALPDLSPGDRETLISGIHEACFDAAFSGD